MRKFQASERDRDELRCVALVDPISHHGGQHYYTDQLARGLARAKVDVTVYGLAGDSILAHQDIYRHRAVFRNIYGNDPAWIRGLRFGVGLMRISVDILRIKPQVVNVNIYQYSLRELFQIVMLKALLRRVVLTIHDVEAFGVKTNEFRRTLIMKYADGLFIHNEYSLQSIPSSHLRGKVAAVIPHVCQVDYLESLPSKAVAREALGLPSDKTILLFFGNPRHEKGLDIALEAMSILQGRPGLMLLTGGRMPRSEEENCRDYVREHRLEGSVRMDVGTVPDELAFTYYAACDAVVVPYRKIYESGVAIMAASCARPIIASDQPVLAAYADGERSGLLFRSEDPADLARAIAVAMGPDASLEAMGLHAKETIVRERNSTLIGRKTVQLYSRILREHEMTNPVVESAEPR